MIKIYGASDDTIAVQGCEGADEFLSYERDSTWRGDLIAPGGTQAMQVHVFYPPSGCWAVAIGQADEDIPLPSWPVKISQHPDIAYSTLLEIDAPAGTRLTNVWPERHGDA